MSSIGDQTWKIGQWGRWFVAQGAVGPDLVVVVSPAFDDDLCFEYGVEDLRVEDLIPEGTQGLPGVMYSGFTSKRPSHFWIASAINSGPLSDRMYRGIPRVRKSSASCSITWYDVI
jgi:hypothetical protein